MKLCQIVSAAIALSFPTIASATDEVPKLTTAECEQILRGLSALDGRWYVSNPGRPNEQVISLPYDFKSGTLRRDIQKNIVDLTAIQKTANAARKQFFDQFAKGQIEVPIKDRPEYSARIREVDETPCELEPKHFRIDALRLEVNEIPGTALADIDKILDK